MRTSRHVVISVWLLALCAAARCGGDSGGGGGIGALDGAGGPDGADGAPSLPDAGGDAAGAPDAGPDGTSSPDVVPDISAPGDAPPGADAAADVPSGDGPAPDDAPAADGGQPPGPDVVTGPCPTEPCPAGDVCVDGECLAACAAAAQLGGSVGCVFWTVDLDQYPDPLATPAADAVPHGVVVFNPGPLAAAVSFTTQAEVTVAVADPEVPPGAARTFVMPRLDVDGSGVSVRSIRMETTQPVAAWQLNPVGNPAASSDGSLLLPDHALGPRYVVASWRSGPEFPPVLGYPPQRGYFTVVATSPGVTDVTVRVTSDTVEGPAVPALPAGGEQTFTLEQFQVLNIEAEAYDPLAPAVHDLTGSTVDATQPVAVFGGHEQAVVAAGPVEPEQDCCADHLEEQLLPVALWATDVVCGKAPPRGTPVESDVWRILSGAAGNAISTDPPVAGLDGVTLGAGEWVEVASATSFAVHGTAPLMAAQLLVGQRQTADEVGDPALVTAVPVPLYRGDQYLVAPEGYAAHWATVVRLAGVPVSVDGAPAATTFAAVGESPWEVGWVALEPGLHRVSAAEPFGLTVFGWDAFASYGFPAGLGAAP